MIPPALTAAQASGEPIVFEVNEDGTLLILRLRDEGEPVIRIGHSAEAGAICGPALLTLAALCLHGRLNWEMIDALRMAIDVYEDEYGYKKENHDRADIASTATDLLESLLPPREP